MNDPILFDTPMVAACAAPDADATQAAYAPPEATVLRRTLDALDVGVMLLDADGTVRFANCRAREALAEGETLRVADGRLVSGSAQCARRVNEALADAAAGTPRLLCLDTRPLGPKLALAPLAPLVSQGGAGAANADGGPAVLATVQTASVAGRPALVAFGRERRLTDGEADVLRRLVDGDDIEAIARGRRASAATVRSQVKRLLEKTGTHSLRELVVEALNLPPMSQGGVRPSGRATIASAFAASATVTSVPVAAQVRFDAAPMASVRRPVVAIVPREDTQVQISRTGARCVRGPAVIDRAAILALRASQFAWPPAA